MTSLCAQRSCQGSTSHHTGPGAGTGSANVVASGRGWRVRGCGSGTCGQPEVSLHWSHLLPRASETATHCCSPTPLHVHTRCEHPLLGVCIALEHGRLAFGQPALFLCRPHGGPQHSVPRVERSLEVSVDLGQDPGLLGANVSVLTTFSTFPQQWNSTDIYFRNPLH